MLALVGLDSTTFGLWAQHASSAPKCCGNLTTTLTTHHIVDQSQRTNTKQRTTHTIDYWAVDIRLHHILHERQVVITSYLMIHTLTVLLHWIQCELYSTCSTRPSLVLSRLRKFSSPIVIDLYCISQLSPSLPFPSSYRATWSQHKIKEETLDTIYSVWTTLLARTQQVKSQ